MFYVGLDLSLRSSGCTIWNKRTNQWLCVSFAANKAQEGQWVIKENVHMTICPAVPKTSQKTVTRYLHVSNHLLRVLCANISTEYRAETVVFIEEYCTKSNQRKTGVRLHESGGVIKCELEKHGFLNVSAVVNSRWKSVIVGKGNATKLETALWVCENGPNVDFLTFFGFSEKALKTGVVPSPVQDLCDATALAKYAHDFSNDCIAKKPKKPKVVIPKSPYVVEQIALQIIAKKEAQKNSFWAQKKTTSQITKRKQNVASKKETKNKKQKKTNINL